jgi:membrane protein/epoxyqueuosine reductase
MGRFARGLEAASLLLIVWGSSGIFMPVEMALNRAWGGQPRTFVRSRGLAFVLTTGCGLLAMLSVGLTVAARAYRQSWPGLAEAGAKASALLLTYLLFFVIYKTAAAPAPPWRVALKAALWGGTAWELAKYAFVVNLARTNLRVVYGPLAFAVALVLWAYLSSLVLVFGALMSPTTARARRSRRRGAA